VLVPIKVGWQKQLVVIIFCATYLRVFKIFFLILVEIIKSLPKPLKAFHI
jgi:hypothetical protein